MSDIAAENRRLRERLASLTEEAAKNEKILKRSQARELELLHAESLPALLHLLVHGMARSFELPAITVVLCDPGHEIRHLLLAAGARLENLRDVIFVDSLVGLSPILGSLQSGWLGRYRGSDHQLIFPGHPQLASVALLPLRRQSQLFGSLNLGSDDPQRFTRHHGTDFLDHLVTIAAFSLENAVNRARLVRSGTTDVLTGWHNRRYLDTRLQEELARAQRFGQTLVCMLLDIDHFKRVNDQFGHLVGDEVLREVAQRVEGEVRASDVAARYGGEEFILLLPRTQMEDALRLAERIRAAVADEPFRTGRDQDIAVTVSVGVSATVPTPQQPELKLVGERLIAEADVALYRAKAEGRNCICSSQSLRSPGRPVPPVDTGTP